MPNIIIPGEATPYVNVFEARLDRFAGISNIDAIIGRRLIETAETCFPLERYGRGPTGLTIYPPTWEIRISDKRLRTSSTFHIGSSYTSTMLGLMATNGNAYIISTLKVPYVDRHFTDSTTTTISGNFTVEIAEEVTASDPVRARLNAVTEQFALLYGALLDELLPAHYITYDVKYHAPSQTIYHAKRPSQPLVALADSSQPPITLVS